MKIPGTNVNIGVTRNAPPAARVVGGDTNSYEDSVAGALTRRFGDKSGVRVNGRAVGAAYNAETIEEIYQGYIFAAIKKTRNQVADILANNTEVYDPKTGNAKDAPAIDGEIHPYMAAIDKAPMDNTLFYAGIATYLMVLGEAFLDAGLRTMAAGNIKDIDALALMQSNQVVRSYNDDGSLASYKLTEKLPNGTEKKTYYVPTNVIALIDLNPWDLRKGYGMIRPIVDKIALENMATKLQTATIANGVKAPGILSSKELLETDEYADLKNQVETRYTSSDMDKAGTPIVTNGGFIDYKSLIEDLDKLAMEKIRDMNRDAFFAALGVSKTILGIEESGTTRDVARVQREQFILDACMPIVNAILNGLNQDYINNYPQTYASKPRRMRAIAPIEKDLEQEKTEAEVNKAKAETFKTLVTAGMDEQQAAEVAGIELQNKAVVKMVREPVGTGGGAPAPAQNATNLPAPVTVNQHNHVHQHAPGALGEMAKNRLSDKQQAKVEKAQNDLRTAVKLLNAQLGEKYAQSVNIENGDQQAYIEALTNALLAYYSVVVPIFGKERMNVTAVDFDAAVAEFVYNEQVREIVRARLAKVANSHFADIDEQLTKIINDGTRDNIPRNDIIKEVQAAVRNDVETWKVERLVQTESSNAFNQATYLADKQFITANGYTGRAYKVWRTNSAKPCPFCTSTAGTRVPFDDNFFNVGQVAEGIQQTATGAEKAVYYPVRFVDVNAGGLHPNCHCDYTLELA